MNSGFEEINHTADWEVRVWAPEFASLIAASARAMYALLDLHLVPGKRAARRLEIRGEDQEALLVGFLSELLVIGEVEQMGFDEISVEIHPGWLVADMKGSLIYAWKPEIKAVTYHRLKIQSEESGLSVRIVFDV